METKAEREARLYLETMGRERAERQRELAKTTCSQCGGRDGQHHQMCKRRRG